MGCRFRRSLSFGETLSRSTFWHGLTRRIVKADWRIDSGCLACRLPDRGSKPLSGKVPVRVPDPRATGLVETPVTMRGAILRDAGRQ
jgi:hypothetical protein